MHVTQHYGLLNENSVRRPRYLPIFCVSHSLWIMEAALRWSKIHLKQKKRSFHRYKNFVLIFQSLKCYGNTWVHARKKHTDLGT